MATNSPIMEVTNRNGGSVNLVDAIRTAIPPIVQNYGSNSIPKEVLVNLITELSSKKHVVERVYLMHYLMQLLSGFHEIEVVRLFSSLLPIPLSSKVADFMRQFISLAVSLENKHILAAGSFYLDSDQVSFPEYLEVLQKELVTKSPHFVAVVISKGFFNDNPKLFPSELLVEWLQGLTKLSVSEAVLFNPTKILEFSLLGKGAGHPDLHLALLEAMERKRIQQIPCDFMLSLATRISSQPDSATKDVLIDRLSQILLVSLQCEVCSKFTPEVKSEMAKLFPNNQLLLVILSAMN